MSVSLFFISFFILVILSSTYLSKKISKVWAPQGRLLTWSIHFLFFAVVALQFIGFILRRGLYKQDQLLWFSFVVMGLFSLILAFFLFSDLVILIFKKIARKKEISFNPKRREFFQKGLHLSTAVAATSISAVGHELALAGPQVVPVNIQLHNFPQKLQGLKVVQISDLHVGPLIKKDFVTKVVEQALGERPDLIVLTGDLVDGSVENLKEDVAPLKNLSAPLGVYFVTGNHEYYSGVGPWIEHFQSLGMETLLNSHRVLEKDGEKFVLAGVTDLRGDRFHPSHLSSPEVALAGAPSGVPKILLAHQPRSIIKAHEVGFDLQLSGHTHAGQYFPFTMLVHLFQPYVKGLHLHQDKTWIYVNSGTGFWGPPNRLGSIAEITSITLV